MKKILVCILIVLSIMCTACGKVAELPEFMEETGSNYGDYYQANKEMLDDYGSVFAADTVQNYNEWLESGEMSFVDAEFINKDGMVLYCVIPSGNGWSDGALDECFNRLNNYIDEKTLMVHDAVDYLPFERYALVYMTREQAIEASNLCIYDIATRRFLYVRPLISLYNYRMDNGIWYYREYLYKKHGIPYSKEGWY